MSRAGRHLLFPVDDGSDRQAPSTLIDSCKGLIRWQYLLGIGWLAFGAANWWLNYLQSRLFAVMGQLYGNPEYARRDVWTIAGEAAGLLIPLAFAVISLRCAAALKKFVRSGLMADLHPAMKRLRAVWRAFAILILSAFGIILAVLVIVAIGWLRHRSQ